MNETLLEVSQAGKELQGLVQIEEPVLSLFTSGVNNCFMQDAQLDSNFSLYLSGSIANT